MGGIAGYGSTLKNCHTLITLQEGSAYVGTVAGSVDPEGTVTGNTFTQEALGAIDGISYAGQAEPVTFGALCAAGAPETFAWALKLPSTKISGRSPPSVKEEVYGV